MCLCIHLNQGRDLEAGLCEHDKDLNVEEKGREPANSLLPARSCGINRPRKTT